MNSGLRPRSDAPARPPTASQGMRHLAHVVLLNELEQMIAPAKLPAVFGYARRGHGLLPLALGARAELAARIGAGAETHRRLASWFGRWCSLPMYRKAVAIDGAQRFDLDGNPSDLVSAEHALVAAILLSDTTALRERLKRNGSPQRAVLNP